ncbi:MAG: cyclic peptide export ABC transporter [Verrucomicrobia bacterium]|nr:cyclic peptide export ABC transporter [Verrucomicrobiota bacterium]
MKVLLFVFRTSPLVVSLAAGAAVLSGLASGGLIALVNSALSGGPGSGSGLGWKFLALVVLSLVTAVAANVTVAWFYRKVVLEMQMRLARRITETPLRNLEEVGSAPLLGVLTDDVAKIGDVATVMVPLIANLATTAACFVYLLRLSPPAFVGTVIFLVLGGLSYKLLTGRERVLLAEGRNRMDSVYRYFHDLTHGLKELKLSHARCERFLGGVLRPAAAVVQRHLFLWDVTFAAISTWGRFLILVVVGLVLFVLPRFVSFSPGVLSGYVLVLLYVRSSLLSALDSLPHLSAAAVSLRKIESFGLDVTAEPVPVSGEGHLPSGWNTLTLSRVTHSYYHDREDCQFTLGPIDLKLRRGEIVFVVGGNGSGKTTMSKVVMGLYPAEGGVIDLDGTVVRPGDLLEYRQLFGAVFTDFHLFEDLLGLEVTKLEEEAEAYLRRLDLDHKVRIEGGRLSTTRALSRGQQQRLALLAAYLEDRTFYIFDEWAANQDPSFREVFYTELLPELRAKGKGVLVISHDDQYFGVADRILKLVDGKIIADEKVVPAGKTRPGKAA